MGIPGLMAATHPLTRCPDTPRPGVLKTLRLTRIRRVEWLKARIADAIERSAGPKEAPLTRYRLAVRAAYCHYQTPMGLLPKNLAGQSCLAKSILYQPGYPCKAFSAI